MAISARNKLQGRVSNIKSGEAMCLVTLDAQGTKIVAAVTDQGVEEFELERIPNDQVTAVIKSTEVMLTAVKGGRPRPHSALGIVLQVRSNRFKKDEAMGLVTVKMGQFHARRLHVRAVRTFHPVPALAYQLVARWRG